jgi:polyhydroxyalkanoate synthase
MAAPIDSSKDNTIVANWARSIDADSIIHEFGYIDGMALDVIFIMRNPTKYLFDRYLKFFSILHDEQYVNNFIALQRWLSDTPPIPGNLYLKIIDDCYRKNLLVSNTMQFDGESIDLSKITVPLLSIVAEDDDLVSPESTLAVASYVSSKDKLSLAIPGDHIGLCISTIAHKKLWPEAAKWILSR